MKKLKPQLDKIHFGCATCGCDEMRRKKDAILVSLRTRIYGGFGGWSITANGKMVYFPPADLEFEEYPTLMKFENMARKHPRKDWRASFNGAMRDAEYQRQGKNRWVLVHTGMGFA